MVLRSYSLNPEKHIPKSESRAGMTSSKLQTLLLTLVLVVAASLSLYGQSTYGTVDGSVVDRAGAAVTGAQVTLTNTGTQEKHTQPTGNEGAYQFVNVIPGEYRI